MLTAHHTPIANLPGGEHRLSTLHYRLCRDRMLNQVNLASPCPIVNIRDECLELYMKGLENIESCGCPKWDVLR